MEGRAAFDPGDKLRRIAGKLEDPQGAPAKIGAMMVAESQRAFKAQEFGGRKWSERAPVNIFGIIADFSAGKKAPPARRFESRPALRDTGRLASSIAFRVSGDTVEVGTTVEYAAVHQKGGKVESKPLTSAVRTALWAWLKKQARPLQRRIGWVLNKKFIDQKLTQKVPARKFLGITDKTRAMVRGIVGVEIMEAD